MKRGHYIAFIGGEGSGKSTQAKKLYDRFIFEGISSIHTVEPGGTRSGMKIRKLLIEKENHFSPLGELFLMEAARAELFNQIIPPSLENGITVIADRSGDCSKAHQGYARGVDLKLIQHLNDVATSKIRPDLTFLIDIDAKKGLTKEQEKNKFSEEGLIYHKRVNAGYLEIVKEDPERYQIINYREGDKEGMHEEIYRHVQHKLFGKIIL